MNDAVWIALLAATIQSGTPVLYATLGEIITEKAGVLNLGVEGMMMVGALAGFVTARLTGSPWLGFLAGGFAGMALGSVHGLVCINLLGNQVVSGLALTIFGSGLANYLGTPYLGQNAPGFSPLPLAGLRQIPVLGPAFFQHDVLVYFSFVLPVVVWLGLTHTRAGLSIRAVGENPEAAQATGINAKGYRWLGVLLGSFCVGCGGAYLSLAYTHLWTNNLTGGRGWIAVALVIFAFWRPGRAVLGAYLFGGVMALQLRLQALGAQIPSSFLLMLPYLLTLIVLVVASYRKKGTTAPAALGINIEPVD